MKSDLDINFVILCILDGWGIAPPAPGNAIALSSTPNMNRFRIAYPQTQLRASGEAVGLPKGEVGNTETGHLNLGAGKIVYQDLARINMSIADGSFYQNQMILGAFDHARRNNSAVHVMGLVSNGGVHSSLEHLYAILHIASLQQFKQVYIHAFTDGRDSAPNASPGFIKQVRDTIAKEGVGTLASVMGRYWAMDRDRRWERTQKAYEALTAGKGQLVKTVEEAIESSYTQGITDEFIEPALVSEGEKPVGLIKENDAVIFFNFRIDRPRQLTKAFILEDFSMANLDAGFDPHAVKYEGKHQPDEEQIARPLFTRGEMIKNLYFVTMTEYSKSITQAGAKVGFPPELVSMPVGRVFAEQHKKQLRVAESEKERFVTYYFNGQQEIKFPGEEHLIIPSPKVPTYDKKPEMSAVQMTDALLEKLLKHNYFSLIVVNYANADMVGHTGNLAAGVTACQVVDQCVGKLASFVLAYGGALVITADHGNAEEMIKLDSGEVDTEHSVNPVPFIVVAKKYQNKSMTLPSGILADVAPTILSLLKLPVPNMMMGKNLLGVLS